jgi:hypothetical protein
MIKAIETRYAGCRFRSRLEARWAVFFDACDIKWEYEPEGFVLDDGTKYLPDFLLTFGTGETLWCEVKPPNSDITKSIKFCESSDNDIMILDGPPELKIYNIHGSFRKYDHSSEIGSQPDDFYFSPLLNEENNCVAISHAHHFPWWDNKETFINRCLDFIVRDENATIEKLQIAFKIEKAVEKAKSARFEFGEQG